MKAISLWQPWASAIAFGLKRVETRHWRTHYRGLLAIHAAKTTHGWDDCSAEVELRVFDAAGYGHAAIAQASKTRPSMFPHGAVIAIAELTDCVEMTPELIAKQSELEVACGNWQPGRFAWVLGTVHVLPKPHAYRGGQGLFELDVTQLGPSLIAAVTAQSVP